MDYKNEIELLDKLRYEFIENVNSHYYSDNQDENNKIDEIGDEIRKMIWKGKEQLTFEFIFEQLTRLGDAPCLLYDDDGKFAITGDGMCSVPTDEDEEWEGTFIVEKNGWFDTIREALYHYITDFERIK